MAEYTKGNWRVIKNDINKPYKFRIETDMHILASVYSETNAHLIAAAPKQNKALLDIVAFVKNNPFIGKDEIKIILDKAQPALAKAEGKE